MKEKDLKHSLQQTFNFSIWKEILPLFFKKIDYFSLPENLFTENDKVIDGKQIGTIKLDDDKQLAIFTVEVADSISIIRNRQGLREIAAKYIDQNIIHGALAFFYNKNQADYRFSFIAKESSIDLETGELIKGETKPKRYTYLLGANEACTTPAKRMLVLADKNEKGEVNINQLKEVFSVEALNKDFFKTYKAHYEKFWKYLADENNPFRTKLIDAEKEDTIKQEKPIRDFSKKLLGRIVFLHFLQKKGWMGVPSELRNTNDKIINGGDWINGDANFMQNLFAYCPEKEKFHSKYLTVLFFKTLNTKRAKDLAPEGLVHNAEFAIHHCKIPYLNGGLFEPEKNKATLKIDFPTDYFKELLEFFDQYNFTIDENSPDDHEVGIDPEMLGHIFENLLEDNRDKGAFYTPKEIVQYMCKESLIQYLKNSPPLAECSKIEVQNSPPLEGWSKTGVVNSPPMEGWIPPKVEDGVVNSPTQNNNVVKRASKNYFDLPYNPALKQRAKELRQAGNLSEVLFWNQVKNKQFKGFDFDRQKIVGNYIVDFYCTNCNVVIEIDGSSHDDKQDYDANRDAYLQSFGLTVIHIPVNDVMKQMNAVMEMLYNHPALDDSKQITYTDLNGKEDKNLTDLNGKEDITHPALKGTPPKEGNWEKDVEQFIRFHIVTPFLAEKENAVLINQKLDDIKVCDPAIGSGAFPIGMLQEIFEAKRFIYPYLKTNKPFDPAQVKKNIIQNSIYGVDLEKGAVDIAQLRFWLSLVVDELNPHPLPNLDYKIMQGNSLLESFEGIDLSQMGKTKSDIAIAEPERDLFGNIIESQMKMTFAKSETINEIQQLIKQFFTIEISEEKQAIRQQINALVLQHIEYNIELRENQLNRFINEAGNPDNLNRNARKKYDGYVADLEKIKDTKANLLKIQETDERPYFLWHLYFMDVFDQGGFDVMIGNPPYIQLQKEEGLLANLYEDKGFETFERTGDIYSLFYEGGIKLLKLNANLNYITSNKWLKANYGKSTREFFLKHQPIKIIDLGSGIFKTATVDTNILLIKKVKNSLGNKSVLGLNISEETIIKDINDFKDRWVLIENLSSDSWAILDAKEFEIKKAIENIGKPLVSWNVNLNMGLKTGMNEAFIIDDEIKENLCLLDQENSKILKPILKGKNIKKYKAKWDKLWLIETHNGYKKLNGEIVPPIDINKYPRIKEHLEQFEPKLSNRGDKGVSPYNLRNCAYQDEFTKEKIVWADIAREPSFSYLGPNIYFNNTVYFIVGDSLKYLLTILNSRVIGFYFQKIGTDLGQDGGRYFKQFVELFPIPNIIEVKRKPYETLAEYLIYLNDPKQAPVLEKVSNEALSQVFEDVVNMMVYELYFEEEMKAAAIDVLQFVTKKAFPDISQAEDKKAVIQKVYYELQQKDNAIRNRILVASSRSETIARINEATS